MTYNYILATKEGKMTNSEFAKTDKTFLAACENVTRINLYQNFKPSTRQASKWRNKKGIAWKVANKPVQRLP
jgi:hypothetical protein